MRWIDGHLDLAYTAVRGRDITAPCADLSSGCVSLPALRDADVRIAIATIFTEPGVFGPDHPHGYPASDDLDAAEAAGLRQLEIYEKLEQSGHIAIMRTRADLTALENAAEPKLGVVLLMEGADPIRSPDHLRKWFDRGLRIIGLTWAAGTRYAGGNADAGGGGPLKPPGVDLIKAMDALGVVHDASHLSDAAWEGLVKHATGLIIASHSNSRALVENKQRHLRDDQIKFIGERTLGSGGESGGGGEAGGGGVVGLNLYSPFLAKGRRATIEDCVAHVQHAAEVMGHRRGVALGSDMDGGFGPKDLPEGLDSPAKLPLLLESLRNVGWIDADRRAFAYDNWRRFLQNVLK
jgi:membrane dipeptidase